MGGTCFLINELSKKYTSSLLFLALINNIDRAKQLIIFQTDLFLWFYQNLREFTKILVNLREFRIYILKEYKILYKLIQNSEQIYGAQLLFFSIFLKNMLLEPDRMVNLREFRIGVGKWSDGGIGSVICFSCLSEKESYLFHQILTKLMKFPLRLPTLKISYLGRLMWVLKILKANTLNK
ncbi:hypothetical protein BpHYR1_000008 [Brachionus plicatilis]|uniref:Uncharacterized protein n=1 Tax=Brachionus plicatilis TaxID=10195 RepID=A0A3M7R0J6_BRAPC|nr:hypothetical protein BpHYR1_000008 [Brachionus plicatilis]